MTLFAIFAVPLFTLYVVAGAAARGLLPYARRSAADAAAGGRPGLRWSWRGSALQFLKGFLYGVAALIVTLLLNRTIPLSYRFFPLYLYYLLTGHLVPAALLVTAFFLFLPRSGLRDLALFAGGFFSLPALVDVLANFGHYDPYVLFLLPVLRMSALLLLSLFFLRFQECYGFPRALFLFLLVLVPFLGAGVSWLYVRMYPLWAWVSAAVLLAAALLYAFVQREA